MIKLFSGGIHYAGIVDLEKRTPELPLSQIQDIYFNDIHIDSQEASCVLMGHPEQKIENLFLSNIHYKQFEHVSFEGEAPKIGAHEYRTAKIVFGPETLIEIR